MQIILKYKKFLIPAFLAFILSGFYIIASPGRIASDAKEYDDLAISISHGKYEIAGAPSMQREPGYPLFRAILKTVSTSPVFILWVQAILYFFTVFLVGLTVYKIDPKFGVLAAWGATLAYGLAFYPSVHLAETLVGFLLALIGFTLIKGIEKPSWKFLVIIALLSGFLLLTRYTYILVPITAFLMLYKYSKKKRHVAVGLLIVLSLVAPWVIRNYIKLGEFNVSGRSGGILYARALRAESSWRSLGDSYISSLIGRGILFSIYPSNTSIWLEQWGDWWRNERTIKEMWGTDPIIMDKLRKKAALEIITRDFNTFAKFVAWTGVDEIRLLQLANPLPQSAGSPIEGTYGPLSQQASLSPLQLTALAIAHFVQLLWFIAIIASTWIGFRKYGLRFIPGIFLICLALPHSIADNIARYGAPLQPWLLSGIFITLIPQLKTRLKKFKDKWHQQHLQS